MPRGSSVLSPSVSNSVMHLLMASLSTAVCPGLDPHSLLWVLGSGLCLIFLPEALSQSGARVRECFLLNLPSDTGAMLSVAG